MKGFQKLVIICFTILTLFFILPVSSAYAADESDTYFVTKEKIISFDTSKNVLYDSNFTNRSLNIGLNMNDDFLSQWWIVGHDNTNDELILYSSRLPRYSYYNTCIDSNYDVDFNINYQDFKSHVIDNLSSYEQGSEFGLPTIDITGSKGSEIGFAWGKTISKYYLDYGLYDKSELGRNDFKFSSTYTDNANDGSRFPKKETNKDIFIFTPSNHTTADTSFNTTNGHYSVDNERTSFHTDFIYKISANDILFASTYNKNGQLAKINNRWDPTHQDVTSFVLRHDGGTILNDVTATILTTGKTVEIDMGKFDKDNLRLIRQLKNPIPGANNIYSSLNITQSGSYSFNDDVDLNKDAHVWLETTQENALFAKYPGEDNNSYITISKDPNTNITITNAYQKISPDDFTIKDIILEAPEGYVFNKTFFETKLDKDILELDYTEKKITLKNKLKTAPVQPFSLVLNLTADSLEKQHVIQFTINDNLEFHPNLADIDDNTKIIKQYCTDGKAIEAISFDLLKEEKITMNNYKLNYWLDEDALKELFKSNGLSITSSESTTKKDYKIFTISGTPTVDAIIDLNKVIKSYYAVNFLDLLGNSVSIETSPTQFPLITKAGENINPVILTAKKGYSLPHFATNGQNTAYDFVTVYNQYLGNQWKDYFPTIPGFTIELPKDNTLKAEWNGDHSQVKITGDPKGDILNFPVFCLAIKNSEINLIPSSDMEITNGKQSVAILNPVNSISITAKSNNIISEDYCYLLNDYYLKNSGLIASEIKDSNGHIEKIEINGTAKISPNTNIALTGYNFNLPVPQGQDISIQLPNFDVISVRLKENLGISVINGRQAIEKGSSIKTITVTNNNGTNFSTDYIEQINQIIKNTGLYCSQQGSNISINGTPTNKINLVLPATMTGSFKWEDANTLSSSNTDSDTAKKIFLGQNGLQKWWIAGKDHSSVVLFAANHFNCSGKEEVPFSLQNSNNYNNSDLKALLSLATGNHSAFTTKELSLIQTVNNEKLYLPAKNNNNIVVGNSLFVVNDKYWGNETFWLKNAADTNNVYVAQSSTISTQRANIPAFVKPAVSIDFSSVLFGSTAKAVENEGIVANSDSFTLRYTKDLGQLELNESKNIIYAESTSNNTYVVVQNENGAWAKKIVGSSYFSSQDFSKTLRNFDGCHIWLEEYNQQEQFSYAELITETNKIMLYLASDSSLILENNTQKYDTSSKITTVKIKAQVGYFFANDYIKKLSDLLKNSGLTVTKESNCFKLDGTLSNSINLTLPSANKLTIIPSDNHSNSNNTGSDTNISENINNKLNVKLKPVIAVETNKTALNKIIDLPSNTDGNLENTELKKDTEFKEDTETINNEVEKEDIQNENPINSELEYNNMPFYLLLLFALLFVIVLIFFILKRKKNNLE